MDVVMTLDPVHFEGIARLARQISHDVDEADHRDLAETVWENFLDPLYGDDGTAVLEPLDGLRRRAAPIREIALESPPFPSTHGLDSGTINPTTFKNGLVLDVAQAAMGANPSDLELHRGRTIVMTAHTNDTTQRFGDPPGSPVDGADDATRPTDGVDDSARPAEGTGPSSDWYVDDAGYARQRIIQAPRVNRYAEGVVHALSLYLAESEHALANADVVSDLLYLDGPLYPKGMLNWLDRDQELASLLVDERDARRAVENYVRLVERFVRSDAALVGFVKNPSSKGITRALRRSTQAPWVDDAALFRQLLERRAPASDAGSGSGSGSGFDADSDVDFDAGGGAIGHDDRRTDELTITNWFVSRSGTDRVMSTAGDRLGVDLELDPEAYEVTFCVLYDPRDDVTYKLEAPYALTRDAATRDAVARQALVEVAAARGPPLAIRKADALARISRDEKESLRSRLEREFATERDRTYDDVRWPGGVEPF